MRIFYVSSLPLTGPSRHMLDLAHQVAHLGHDVEVVAAEEEVIQQGARLGLSSKRIPLRHKLDVAGARRLARALRGADVVHSHDRRAGLFARLARVQPSVARVHTVHGLPYELSGQVGRNGAMPRGSVSRLAELRAVHATLRAERWLARIGSTIVPSRALRDWLVEHGWPAQRTRAIPNGLAVAPDPGPITHDPPRFATAAYLDHHKGVDVLVEAAARATVPLRLDVYGEGPTRAALEMQGRAAGVDAVFFGFVEEFRARRADYDVFVLPSRGDNLPVAIFEAMAAAAPVIATRVGGIPEQVEDGVTGLIVPPEDPVALARALDCLAGDAGLRRSMGLAGRERLARMFEPRRIASEVVALYEEVIRR